MLSKLILFDSDSLKLLHRRVFFSITIFIFVYFISIYRISSIMLFPDLNDDTTNYIKKDIRGSIYDRNGNIIATSIESISLSINPNKIPPTNALLPAAAAPARAASKPPVAAPAVMELIGSSFPRIATSVQSKKLNKPPQLANCPPKTGARDFIAVILLFVTVTVGVPSDVTNIDLITAVVDFKNVFSLAMG